MCSNEIAVYTIEQSSAYLIFFIPVYFGFSHCTGYTKHNGYVLTNIYKYKLYYIQRRARIMNANGQVFDQSQLCNI